MANENGLKSLDENLRQLEQLVSSLNDTSLSIDEAIARYSEVPTRSLVWPRSPTALSSCLRMHL